MRRPATFLFVLALAARAGPVLADVPGKPVGLSSAADGPSLNGCGTDEAVRVRMALGVAANLAASCLGSDSTPGLAPDIGQKVLGLYGKGKLQVFCDGAADDNANASTTFKDGKPQIAVYSKTNGVANDMSPENLGGALLHELIHAADPDRALVASQTLHDKAYPDRVYGCHLACTGHMGNEGIRARLALLVHAAGQRLAPAGGGVRCPAQGPCGFHKLMGGLCGPEGDRWVALERSLQPRFEQTGCLLQAVAVKGQCKAEVCADIVRQVKEASADGPPSSSLVGALMIHLYDVVVASGSQKDREALNDRDAALLEAVKSEGLLARCRP